MHMLKSDGRKYIGITKHGEDPNKRWQNGNGYIDQDYFYNAIRKYGWDAFEHMVLFNGLTKEQAVLKEKACIKLFNTQDRLSGFNLTAGGDGVTELPSAVRTKIILSNTKHYISEDELKHCYIDLKWTMRSCAKHFNCSVNTIQRNLDRAGIQSRTLDPKNYITKDVLIELLIVEGKTRKEAAEILNCSLGTIAKYMKKFNIKLSKQSSPIPTYAEIYYNYITLNRSRLECSNYFNCTESMFKSWLHLYNIKKDHKESAKNSPRYRGSIF